MIIQSLGWLGTLFIVMGYIFASLGKVNHNSKVYLWGNLLGSLFVVTDALRLEAIQPIILNLCFAGFSLFAILNIKLPKMKASNSVLFIFSILIGLFYGFVKQDIFQGMGLFSIAVLTGSYLLFTQGDINRENFILNNLLANALYLPILVLTYNYPSLGINFVALLVSIIGLLKIKRNKIAF